MLRLLRRNWLQVLGLSATVAFVCALAAAGCGGSPAGRPAAAASTATARPSATADPRVAQVEAAVKAWNQAQADAYRTGDASGLHALCVPDSQADGNIGGFLVLQHDDHRTSVITSIAYQSLHVDVLGESAIASTQYTIAGYLATWPDLRPVSQATTQSQSLTLDFQLWNGKWLVDSYR